MRLIFMGSPAFALPTLSALIEAGHNIVGVYSQPPRPANRGKKVTPCPVHAFAEEKGFAVHTPQKLRDEQAQEIKALAPDIIVVVAYGLILPKSVLDIPRYGCINLHPSLLPRWRGAAPIHRPIIEGDEVTGVTIMQMDEGCDTGPILVYKKVPLTADSYADVMQEELAKLGAELIVQTIVGLEHGLVKPIPQDNAQATYAAKLDKDDGRLEWKKTAPSLARLIRGTQPWPGAWFNYKGEQIKVLRATALDQQVKSAPPGQVITAPEVSGGKLWVATGSGTLQLDMLQRPNRNALPADEFLRGFAMEDGDMLQ